MTNKDTLKNIKQISVIGLGETGQSLSKLLFSIPDKPFKVIGYDSDSKIHNEMKKASFLDSSEWNLNKALEESDLIFVCVPKDELKELFNYFKEYIKKDCVIIDTSVFKEQANKYADSIFGDDVSFIGGRPIMKSNNEKNYFILIPSLKASSKSMETVIRLVKTLGFTPLFFDKDEHDNLMFALYGLPNLISTAYRNLMMESPSWREIRKLYGADFLQLAEISMKEIDDENYLEYLHGKIPSQWIKRFNKSLTYIIEPGTSTKQEKLNISEEFRNKLIKLKAGIDPNKEVSLESNKIGDGILELFLGSKFLGLFRKWSKKNIINSSVKKKE